MPEDGVVQIAFDRHLLPLSVSRQSVNVVTAANEPLAQDQAPNVLYDPIARTVTLVRPAFDRPWLTPGLPYKVRFAIPKSDDDAAGLRAIDGATLDRNQPLEFSFFVAPKTATARSLLATLGEPESVSFCKDVLPIFQAKCSSPQCHGDGPGAAASLVLGTADGVRRTALNRLAQGANTGGLAGQPRAESTRFAVDMPIIDVALGASTPVGNPGNSWLVYKIDMAEPPATPAKRPPFACREGTDVTPAQSAEYTPLAPGFVFGDPGERALLSNEILGPPMPYPVLGGGITGYEEQALTFQERETIRMWIARGAETPSCGICTF